MRIERKVENVRVVRHRTILEALRVLARNPSARKAMFSSTEEIQHNILDAPLARVYEGDVVYRRDCGVVSVREVCEYADFVHRLTRGGYYPAGTNETVAYLSVLAAEKVRIDGVVHLGTRILDESYQEYRLLMRAPGLYELLPFFPRTKLQPGYHIVVVREEEVPIKKR